MPLGCPGLSRFTNDMLSSARIDVEVRPRKPTWDLGVSLGFLEEFLQELDDGPFKGDPNFTTDDLVEKFIKPKVKDKQCRYVDFIDSKFVKPPTVFVSHRWKGGFRYLVERLFRQFNLHADPRARELAVWIDVFAVNQNQNDETKQDVDSFETVIRKTDITAFNLDDKGEALRRVWCLYEVWKTFSCRTSGAESLMVMSHGIKASDLRQIYYTVDVEKAEAFKQSDVEWILADVKKEFDFQQFNTKVRVALLESTTRQVERIAQGGEGVAADEQFDALNQRQELLSTVGQYAEALPFAQRMLQLAETKYGPEHQQVGVAKNNLGELYSLMGKYDDALPELQRSLAIKKQVYGAEDPESATGLSNLGFLFSKMGKYDEAESLYKDSLAIRQRVLGREHPDVASCKNRLGRLYFKTGRLDDALREFQSSLEIVKKWYNEGHPEVSAELLRMGLTYTEMGKYDDALGFLQRSLPMRENVFGKEHPQVANVLVALADAYEKAERYKEAKSELERALAIQERMLGGEHPYTKDTRHRLETVHSKM